MIHDFIDRAKEEYVHEVTSLGGTIIYSLIGIVFLILGNFRVFFQLLFGILAIFATVIIIKIFYFKNRPRKYKYSNFIEKIDASSFPSVHSARSAFLAAVLTNYFKYFIISAILAASVILVAYSRLVLKKHDLKDVLAGIALGILIYFPITFIY